MSETHEVEYRAIIPESVFSSILEKVGKDSVRSQVIHDVYFCPKTFKNFEQIEMNEVGSYSLRLRKRVMDGKEEITLNTKTITQTGDHNAWEEHETSVSSYEESKKILETVGFKSFFEFTKDRYSFLKDEISVNLEDVKDFGKIIEVEILTTEENAERAKTDLLLYLKNIGITEEMIVEKSVTNLLMKKLAKF